MEQTRKSIVELANAANYYRQLRRGHNVDFALGLIILFKRFYDQKEIIPGLITPKEFMNTFDELKQYYSRSPEIYLDKLCRIIDEHKLMDLSLSMKIVELQYSNALDYSPLTEFLKILIFCDLTDKQLEAENTSFDSFFHSICNLNKSSRYRSAVNKLGEYEIQDNVLRTMMHFLRAETGNKVYCPYDFSIAITKKLHLRVEEAEYFNLNTELDIAVQARDNNQVDMHQLMLLANGVANVEFHNSDPLSRPLLEPRESEINISKSIKEEILEDIKKDKLRQFDRAIALIPFGLKLTNETVPTDRFNRFKYGTPKSNFSDYLIIQHIISTLTDKGIAVVLCPKGPLLRNSETDIRKSIIDDDILEAVIQLPGNICGVTSVPLIMLVFNKLKEKHQKDKIAYIDAQQILVGDFYWRSGTAFNLFKTFEDKDDVCKIVSKYEIEKNKYNLNPQLYVDDSIVANQLRGLLVEHKNYKLSSFSEKELVLKVKKLRTEKDIDEDGNCIYVPSISSMQPVTNIKSRLENSKTPIDRYYQVHLNKNLVIAEFAEFFFQTELGKLIFLNIGEGETVPHVNLDRLMQCKLATPPISVQQDILETFTKFDKLDTLVREFKKGVVLNPESSASMSNKLDDMIASVTKLSEEEVVLGLIRGGENRHVEFKETFEFNKHLNGNRDSRLVDACIKTIGAFLNSGGGDLLVGVADDRKVIGIERDIKMNKGTHDSFLLHFKNFIEKRIGQEYYSVIDQKIILVKGKPILRVRCNSAKEANLSVVFVDNEDCYVRTNPATDKLTGRELETFLRTFRD